MRVVKHVVLDRDELAIGETLPASSDATQDTLPAPARAPARFTAGQRVAERYEIVRFIAAGGMGEVYEARDRELDVAVALKTIRAERTDRRTHDYFRREIQIARKVTHQSVCRIFDVGFHEQVTFLTMELIRGETLAERIAKHGPFAPGDALPIVEQMCAALTAAHAAGVVHRDLKTGNIMLAGTRAVVTDFGLARPAAGQDLDVQTSDSADLVGTPNYMAPEQIVGAPATPAFDIYALGVVMYEMVTGKLPFAAATPMAVIAKRLAEAAPSPRREVPGLDPRWTRAIERCLEREAGDRFATAADVASALASAAPRRHWIIPALAVVAAAGVGAFALLRSPARHAAAHTVAVLGFSNSSHRADADWIATGLDELLDAQLAGTLHVISSDTVTRVRTELSLGEPGALGSAALDKVRADIGADVLIFGTYTPDGSGGIGLELELLDRDGTRTLRASGALPVVAAQAAAGVREALGIARAADATHGVLPADPTAARAYAEGLAALRASDALTARDRLTAAVAADPEFSLAHAALARASSQLGDDPRARAEAKLALDRADQLSPRDAHLVRAQFFAATDAWTKAADEYRAVVAADPSDLDAALGLSNAQGRAGDADGALATIAALRALPNGQDPRIDLAEVRAAAVRNDFRHQQTAAARGAERARATGALLLFAQARLDDAWASRRLGDNDRADRAFGEARAVFEQLGDKHGLADVHRQLANDLIDRGDFAGARRETEAALAVYDALGDRIGLESAYSTLGEVLQDQGDLAGAHSAYEKALANARAIDSKDKQAGALLNLGIVTFHQGDLDAASSSIAEALPTFRAAGNHYAEGLAVGMLGAIARARGDLAQAKEHYADAFATLRAAGIRADADEVSVMIADVARVSGDLAGARVQLADVRAECKALSLDRLLGPIDLLAARLDLDDRNYQAAADAARAIADTFARDHARNDEARARALRAIALAESKQDASGELSRATELARDTQDAWTRAELAIATARVHRSLPELRALVAAKDTPFEQRLEARLVLARLTRDRAALDALAHDATAAGFQTIADAARARF